MALGDLVVEVLDPSLTGWWTGVIDAVIGFVLARRERWEVPANDGIFH